MPKNRLTTTGLARIATVLALLSVSMTMLIQVVSAQSATPSASPVVAGGSVEAATAWLVGKQMDGGGFPGFSGKADVGTTTDATIALAAASASGVDVHEALRKAVAYLDANGADYAKKGVGQAAKLVLAIESAHGKTSDVAGVDPLTFVTPATAGANGLYGGGVFDHAYVILALVSARDDVSQAAIDALGATQIADGSWGFDGKTTAGNGDTNTTALVIQALVAGGQKANPVVAKGLAYLKSTQTATGGFPFQGGATAIGDANSTALVVQAVIALGQDPASADWKHAAAALNAFQNGDGAFRFQNAPPDDNLFSTVQAIPAIAGFDLGTIASGDEATPIAA